MTEQLEQYILAHIDPEPPNLAELDRDTHVQMIYWHMCAGHLQGRLLKMLVRMARPRLVLELGTFSGYSALCLAEGLHDDDCRVHTVEINDEQEDFIASHLARSPYAARIVQHWGDARQVVPRLGLTFDLVYIDANKRQYADYYELALTYLRPGGFILADNTLWGGKVATDGHHDAQTEGIIRFNDLVAADPRVEKVIVPLRDGLTLIYKK